MKLTGKRLKFWELVKWRFLTKLVYWVCDESREVKESDGVPGAHGGSSGDLSLAGRSVGGELS